MKIDKQAAEYWQQKMETSERGARAQQNFLKGYNCSQAVALAFADLIDMDESLLLRAVSSFGGGLGRSMWHREWNEFCCRGIVWL